MFKDMTVDELNFTQKLVDEFYDGFIKKVSDARKMTPEAVDKIAQGRIWGAEDAKKIGIIDEIGSLDDAVKYAAKTAEIKDFNLSDLKIYTKTGGVNLSDLFSIGIKSKISEYLPIESNSISTIIDMTKNNEKILMMVPYDMEIK